MRHNLVVFLSLCTWPNFFNILQPIMIIVMHFFETIKHFFRLIYNPCIGQSIILLNEHKQSNSKKGSFMNKLLMKISKKISEGVFKTELSSLSRMELFEIWMRTPLINFMKNCIRHIMHFS